MDPEEQPQAGAPPGAEAGSQPPAELRADETAGLPSSLAHPAAAASKPEDEELEEDWEEEPRGRYIALPAAILIALATLLIGLAAGFYVAGGVNGTALLTFAPTPTPRPTAVTPAQPQAQPTPDMKALLAMLVSKTRHFEGSANAPVTMIEFSDFQ